jgi:hypothetical protein
VNQTGDAGLWIVLAVALMVAFAAGRDPQAPSANVAPAVAR